MPARGDVLRLKSRIGFGARGHVEAVAVLQNEDLAEIVPTVLVVPLDVATDVYAGHPAAPRVPAAEAGASVDHVAVVYQLRPLAVDAAAPGIFGRLGPETLESVDRALRLVLGL